MDRDLTRATRRAVFLDRDGTLNVDREYVGKPEDVELVPGALEGTRMLGAADFALVIVSNQSGIARGYFSEAQADLVDARVIELLNAGGASIAASYRCPHLPQADDARYARDCDCRKPRPGLILRAARDLDLDLPASWAVGDRARDVTAGKAAGCRTVWVPTVPPAQGLEDFGSTPPDYRARDLEDAARLIVAHA